MKKYSDVRRAKLLESTPLFVILMLVCFVVDILATRGTLTASGTIRDIVRVNITAIVVAAVLDFAIPLTVSKGVSDRRRKGRAVNALVITTAAIVFSLTVLTAFGNIMANSSDAAGFMEQTAASSPFSIADLGVNTIFLIIPLVSTTLLTAFSFYRAEYVAEHDIEQKERRRALLEVFTKRLNEFADFEHEAVYGDGIERIMSVAQNAFTLAETAKNEFRHDIAAQSAYPDAQAVLTQIQTPQTPLPGPAEDRFGFLAARQQTAPVPLPAREEQILPVEFPEDTAPLQNGEPLFPFTAEEESAVLPAQEESDIPVDSSIPDEPYSGEAPVFSGAVHRIEEPDE